MSSVMPPAGVGAGRDGTERDTPGLTPDSTRPLRMTAPATSLQAFFHIARLWKLSVPEQMILLGLAARSTFFQWKRCGEAILPRDTSERIFYLLGIHQALLALLPDGASLPVWLRQSGETQVSPGSSVLRRMLLGRVADLYVVRGYLMEASQRKAQREPGA
jgi:hypothetical protein